MEETIFRSDDLVVMNLINYFITEENYNPMLIHGLSDEIWLENLDSDYKIIRIVSHHIHNKEQLDFDKFKLNKIVKQVKRKTFSFSIKVLNIYTDIENEKILMDNDVFIKNENDIDNPKLTNIFPNIVDKTKHNEKGIEYFVKVSNSINAKNETQNKLAEKIFSKKNPTVTYAIMSLCIVLFILMYVLGYGSEDKGTLLYFGANLDYLVKEGQVYRLLTCIFLHIGICHLLCNMYSLYVVGKEIENLYGKIKYLIIFFGSGICGSIMSIAFTKNTISAGASGAIFGLLGSLLYFGYYYRNYLGNSIKRSVLPVIIVNLAIGFASSGIDNAAHIGGLVGGILLSMLVGVPGKSSKRDNINGVILTILYIAFISYLAFVR